MTQAPYREAGVIRQGTAEEGGRGVWRELAEVGGEPVMAERVEEWE